MNPLKVFFAKFTSDLYLRRSTLSPQLSLYWTDQQPWHSWLPLLYFALAFRGCTLGVSLPNSLSLCILCASLTSRWWSLWRFSWHSVLCWFHPGSGFNLCVWTRPCLTSFWPRLSWALESSIHPSPWALLGWRVNISQPGFPAETSTSLPLLPHLLTFQPSFSCMVEGFGLFLKTKCVASTPLGFVK